MDTVLPISFANWKITIAICSHNEESSMQKRALLQNTGMIWGRNEFRNSTEIPERGFFYVMIDELVYSVEKREILFREIKLYFDEIFLLKTVRVNFLILYTLFYEI